MGRPAEDLATRFERLVDRTGEHHLWLGSVNPTRGTGRIKVGNVTMTAHRVAWEVARGALPPNERVVACTANLPAYPSTTFTSSELLDAGFSVSVVAQRQGHGPQVLTRHYSKSRASSDKRASEHLGRVVHGRS
jgi:hypothetical protein